METIINILRLITRPYRHYADFSGRSGRPEFLLFVAGFVLLTQLAWYGGYHAIRYAELDTVPSQRASHSHDLFGQWHDSNHQGELVTRFDKHGGVIAGSDIDGNAHFAMLWHKHPGDIFKHFHMQFAAHESSQFDPESGFDRGHAEVFHSRHKVSRAERVASWAKFLVFLAIIIPALSIAIRRFHDSNKSGWWHLFWFIPVAGWIVMIIFFLLSGDRGANRFGGPPSPRAPAPDHGSQPMIFKKSAARDAPASGEDAP